MDSDATQPFDTSDPAGLAGQLRSTVGRLYRRFRSERSEGSLGETALEVLTFLDKRGPHTLTELSEAAQVAPASMSQTVNRLTSAGYAVRTPDAQDRRKVLIGVTATGAELSLTTRRQRNAWLQAQVQSLTDEDRDVIIRACEILGDIADA